MAEPLAPFAVARDAGSRDAPRLRTTSSFGQSIVPANRRLGTFAVDLGLSLEGEPAVIQRDYLMARILSRVGSKLTELKSDRKCHLVLSADYYPYLRGFLSKSNSSDASDDARFACITIFRAALNQISVDKDDLISEVLLDLHSDLVRNRQTGPDVARKLPVLAATRILNETIRRLYDGSGLAHALLSADPDELAKIGPTEFLTWFRGVFDRSSVRLISEDQQMWPVLGVTSENEMPLLPEMPLLKPVNHAFAVRDLDTSAIRATVLIAIDPPAGGKVRDEALVKYCPGLSEAADENVKENSTKFHCWFQDLFGRETWAAIYFDADEGADTALRQRARQIAEDPAIIDLAAKRSEGGRPGRPYVVVFGNAEEGSSLLNRVR